MSDQSNNESQLKALELTSVNQQTYFSVMADLIKEYFHMAIVVISFKERTQGWQHFTYGMQDNILIDHSPLLDEVIANDNILIHSDPTSTQSSQQEPLFNDFETVGFYCGIPIHSPNQGTAIGVLSLIDYAKHEMDNRLKETLAYFIRLIENHLTLQYKLNSSQQRTVESLYIDRATGLPNENLFTEHLENEIRVQPDYQLLICCFEIERLEATLSVLHKFQFNQLLKEIAHAVECQVGEEIILARSGLNRFLILNTLASNSDYQISRPLKQLIDTFKRTFTIEDTQYQFNVLMGCSIYPEDGQQAEELITKATIALQAHKHNPSINYHFYSESHSQEIQHIFKMEAKLKDAIDQAKLQVNLQPIVTLPDQQIESYEALCRWHDTELGHVSPAEFIPLAERTGLIKPLSYLIIDTIIEYLSNLTIEKRLPIAVNIPADLLLDPNFPEIIEHQLQTHHLTGQHLRFEITESLLIEDFDYIDQQLKRLAKSKIHFGIDDFGTGFSALAYLTRLPMEFVKIDRAFIDKMVQSQADAVLVQSIIQLVRRLGYVSVAEGVDDEQKLTYLIAYQCHKAQGFLFHGSIQLD